MTFYANGKAVSPIAVWGSPTEKGNIHVLAKHVAYGDPLSYYLSLDKGGEVVVDLGGASVIDCLEYMPRNDDNFISPGDTYELFCHAGTEGWKSLGKQRADTTCLDWIVPEDVYKRQVLDRPIAGIYVDEAAGMLFGLDVNADEQIVKFPDVYKRQGQFQVLCKLLPMSLR